MELTAEQFATFDKRLQALEQGQQALEQGQQALEQGQQTLEQGQQTLEQRLEARIIDSQARIIQWVIGLFIGSMVLMTTLGGVYISVLLAH